MESCLFCNGEEKHYKPAKDKEFLCGLCIQKFLQLDKNQFGILLKKLMAKNQERKIKAVRMFYKGEPLNDPAKRKRRKVA